MLTDSYGEIERIIEEHIKPEISGYEVIGNKVLDLDPTTTRLFLINFLVLLLSKGKIMLKKEEINYEFRKH